MYLGVVNLPRWQVFCSQLVMPIKFFCLALLVLLVACDTDDDPKKIERWYLESWEASSGCFFPDDIPEKQNQIVETLLGLEDTTMKETELYFGSDGEMQILKNNELVLSGGWNYPEQKMLTLKVNDQFWNFEVVNKNKDSLVLRMKNYQFIYEAEMVLKAR